MRSNTSGHEKWLGASSKGAFFMFASSSIVTPICLVEIGSSLSINLSQRGGIESARSFAIVVILLLCGLLARRWGKKALLCLGLYLMALGLFLIGLSKNYLLLLTSTAILGGGSGFIEALIGPLVFDLYPEDAGRQLNFTNAFYSLGVFISVLVFGELLVHQLSWRRLYMLCSFGTLAAATMVQTSKFPVNRTTNLKTVPYISILTIPQFWLFAMAIFFAAGAESGITFWGASYIQQYFSGIPRAGAIGVALFSAMMFLGRIMVSRLTKRVSYKSILIASGAAGAFISCLLLYFNKLTHIWIILALSGIFISSLWPGILAAAAETISKDITMLFVLLSAAGIGGFSVIPWAMGAFGDIWGLRRSFIFIPACLIALIVFLIPVKKECLFSA